MLSRLKLQAGVTLVELMIAVVIIAFLAAAAVPSMGKMIQDSKTRTIAEALQNGLRIAKTEAVRRGRQVEFFLTDATPDLSVASSASGRNWGIQEISLTSNSAETFVQGATLLGAAGSVVVTGSAAAIRFNSIGRMILPTQEATFNITNPNGSRKLNVTVALNGAIRMCDPDKSRSATTPDGC